MASRQEPGLTYHDRVPPTPGRRARRRLVLAVIAVGMAVSACGAGSGGPPASQPLPPSADQPTAAPSVSSAPATPSLGHADHATDPAGQAAAAAARPLAGKIVGIDPGHNGGNFTDASYVDHQVWNGREWEACDTTGTETDAGFTEAQFNFDVARYLRADLRRDGARVVMTRTSNDGVGPCIDRRAEIINAAHADVAVDIHSDGGPASGRGFTILEPVGDGPNDAVITSSQRFGSDLRQAFLADVPALPESTYIGSQGIMARDDLAGLNLTTVPKVLIEIGNMRNATDAQMLGSASFQELAARAIAAAIVSFLRAG
jgi:N-acetylmuramoyl-L-alanine amidase